MNAHLFATTLAAAAAASVAASAGAGPISYISQTRAVYASASACSGACAEDEQASDKADMSDFDDSVSAFAFISSQSSPASALGESTAAQVSSLGEFAIIATGSAYALASELQPPRATAQASSTFSVSFEITEPRSFFLDASIVAVEGDLAGAGEAEVRLLDQNGALLDENVFNADPFSPAVSQRSTLRGVLQPGVYSIQTAARAIVESVDPFDAESEATFDLLLTLCPADLTVDGQVGSADLQFILGNWLSDDPIADLDGNGVVSTGDLAIMLGSWGACR